MDLSLSVVVGRKRSRARGSDKFVQAVAVGYDPRARCVVVAEILVRDGAARTLKA